MAGERLKTNDLISVLMPAHNAGDYLIEAVSSILKQDHSNIELILIDDHSADGWIEVAKKKFKHDSRMNVVALKQRGIVAALNMGAKLAKGKYIARMDADDIAHPSRLSAQLRHMESNPHIDICGTKVEMFSDEYEISGGYRLYQEWINKLCSPKDIEREFFIESPIAHPTAMLRTELFKSLGGYQDCSWPEDYDLWCRALIQGFSFGKPNTEKLLKWRDHSVRLSRSDSRYSKQQFLQCKAYYLANYLNQKNITAGYILGTGPTGLKLHDYLQQNNFEVLSFIDVNPKMASRLKRGKSVTVLNANLDDTKQKLKGLAEHEIIICAVSSRGARTQIRNHLKQAGLKEGINFMFAA